MISNYIEKLKQYINENEEISTSDFVEIMGTHTSVLILLLILSVLNIILAPLPINSFILGVPLIFFSICYLFGLQKVIFSKKLLRKKTLIHYYRLKATNREKKSKRSKRWWIGSSTCCRNDH